MFARHLAGAFVLVVVASPARAGVPDPRASTLEADIIGSSSGAAVGDGFRVTIRDVGSNPLAGKRVELIFPVGVRPYAEQVGGATADCGTRTISKATNGFGVAILQPRFGGYANTASVQVISEGVLLRELPARSTDLDANGRTDLGDLNHFRQNFLLGTAGLETDYDESGATDLMDFNLFRAIFVNDVPGTVCP